MEITRHSSTGGSTDGQLLDGAINHDEFAAECNPCSDVHFQVIHSAVQRVLERCFGALHLGPLVGEGSTARQFTWLDTTKTTTSRWRELQHLRLLRTAHRAGCEGTENSF